MCSKINQLDKKWAGRDQLVTTSVVVTANSAKSCLNTVYIWEFPCLFSCLLAFLTTFCLICLREFLCFFGSVAFLLLSLISTLGAAAASLLYVSLTNILVSSRSSTQQRFQVSKDRQDTMAPRVLLDLPDRQDTMVPRAFKDLLDPQVSRALPDLPDHQALAMWHIVFT